MQKFRPPYRISRIMERALSRHELTHCELTMEELKIDDEERQFPYHQYDTARVFIKYKEFTVNILGVIQNGIFYYQANGYLEDNTPWNPSYHAQIDKLDELIDFVVKKFDSVPKD